MEPSRNDDTKPTYQEMREVAKDFVIIDDTTLPLVTFQFMPCGEPTEEQFQAYLWCFEHIMMAIATETAPVVLLFDLREGTARDPSIVPKQVSFNKRLRPLFYERLGATAILVDSDFYRGIIKMVFRLVKRVRPNHACKVDQEAKAFLSKELAKFMAEKAEAAQVAGGSAA